MKKYLVILVLSFILAGCSHNTATNPQQNKAVDTPQSVSNSQSVGTDPAGGSSVSTDSAVSNNAAEVVIDMTAKKWTFEPSRLEVKKGEVLKLRIKSIDVSHGFALPDFNINQRLEPGQTREVNFVADKVGTFNFFCNVYCGVGHVEMVGQLIVQ